MNKKSQISIALIAGIALVVGLIIIAIVLGLITKEEPKTMYDCTEPRPTGCNVVHNPVCGSDTRLYHNSCWACGIYGGQVEYYTEGYCDFDECESEFTFTYCKDDEPNYKFKDAQNPDCTITTTKEACAEGSTCDIIRGC